MNFILNMYRDGVKVGLAVIFVNFPLVESVSGKVFFKLGALYTHSGNLVIVTVIHHSYNSRLLRRPGLNVEEELVFGNELV